MLISKELLEDVDLCDTGGIHRATQTIMRQLYEELDAAYMKMYVDPTAIFSPLWDRSGIVEITEDEVI